MLIDALRVRNYKSFRDSGWLCLGATFTVIVGQNNVGKTAILEAFRLNKGDNKPYRGLAFPVGLVDPTSRFDIKLTIAGNELEAILLRTGLTTWIQLPAAPFNNSEYAIHAIFSNPKIGMEVSCSPQSRFQATRNPCHDAFLEVSDLYVAVGRSDDRTSIRTLGQTSGQTDALPHLIEAGSGNLIYVFKAERLNIGTHATQDTDLLEPDARNLPAVLSKLQGKPARWERFNEHVITIFPAIKRVSVRPVGGNLGVFVWGVDPNTERDDLAIPLEESGTGIGQALAILYVAMSRSMNVIVIDEPNSFLHPGAAKKLIQILKQYRNNQYVISTHSPEMITTIAPDVVHLVEWNGQESEVTQLDGRVISDMNRVLTDIGVELMDVFGADRIIWVEGPTEQRCFPIIATATQHGVPPGTVFVPLRNTGDLEARAANSQAIWEIYERLSTAPALLPPTLAFSFDRESRTTQVIEDMGRRSKGRAHFLPRATYENYLLNPSAIFSVLTDDYHRYAMDGVPNREAIAQWIESNSSKSGTRIAGAPFLQDTRWMASCNAPKLLSDLFSEISDQRLTFSKLTHSIALTEWMLKNKPEELSELRNYVTALVGTKPFVNSPSYPTANG